MNVEDIIYKHEGLTQVLQWSYNVKNCRRYSNNTEHQFEQVIKLNLPLFMTIPVWKRHGYSISDITTTLNFFSSMHLWQCALLFGIIPSNSAIKIAFSTRQSMVFGSKAIVIRKLVKLLEDIFTEDGSVLDDIRDDHIPPLPLHKINIAQYEKIYKWLPKKKINMLKDIYIEDFVRWKDIKIAPLYVEKGALLCVRIIDVDVFNKSKRDKKSLSNKPLSIIIKSVQYVGVEECMFFVT